MAPCHAVLPISMSKPADSLQGILRQTGILASPCAGLAGRLHSKYLAGKMSCKHALLNSASACNFLRRRIHQQVASKPVEAVMQLTVMRHSLHDLFRVQCFVLTCNISLRLGNTAPYPVLSTSSHARSGSSWPACKRGSTTCCLSRTPTTNSGILLYLY